MATILVTGGAGFIGTALTRQLLGSGHRVVVLDTLVGARAGLLPAGVPLYRVDVRDPDVRGIMAREQPDAVVHLAAQIDVRASVRDPLHDAEVNVVGTLNVLEACRRSGVRKVVVASSGGCIYGEPASLPVREDHPRHPESPYGISKAVLEDYLRFYRGGPGIDSWLLAFGNVYGPGQDPAGEAGVVAIFLGALLDGTAGVIYGDGSQTRDFVYVEDAVSALVAALGHDGGELVNIGTGRETSVLELWRRCADAVGARALPSYQPAREGELSRIALDASRARALLGWTPHTSLADGIGATARCIAAERGPLHAAAAR